MANKTNTVSKWIAYMVLILILLGGIGAIVYFTQGFTGSFKTFYVAVDGENVLSEKSGIVLDSSNATEVDVKYTFDVADQNDYGYSVKIVPTKGSEFFYIMDDKAYMFSKEEDLSAGFNIKKEKNSFTIAPKGNLRDIVSSLYPDKEIQFDKNSLVTDVDMVDVIVTSYNGESSVVLHCRITTGVQSVEFDKEEIIL